MTVLDPDVPIDERPTRSRVSDQNNGPTGRSIRVEPLLDLEWHRAVEPVGPIGAALRPAQTRRSWIHRAPESQVLNLYNAVRSVIDEFAAPWWLHALAAGQLQSRLGAFAVEDQITQVLDSRPDWAYMPWTGPGEDGYWEYVPDDLDTSVVPTTIMFTARHPGWLDLIPAHTSDTPFERVPIGGAADLRARIEQLERG
jgi:hypothetical protein